MGGLRTHTISPAFTVLLAFSCAPPMLTCPLRHAAVARVRVLKIRAAHSHLSMRASWLAMVLMLVLL